ncbi:MAG: RNA polymerase sigma factor (sigma-70 family) [Limisphaerales bacterium]|jgi:RNA polymerase sigma factor (sigma-70 family)
MGSPKSRTPDSALNRKLADQKLIRRCVSGDRDGHSQLYDTYSARMFSICLRYADDYHAAEDLLQDGFVKVFRNIESFRAEGSFEGWLRRIFVNTAIEKHRRKHHLYPLLEVADSDIELHDESALNNLAAQDLMKLINSLSPGYRTVFNLYAIEGYPHKEIAEQLGISEGTSKSQLARARYILQKQVAELISEHNAIGSDSRIKPNPDDDSGRKAVRAIGE